MKTIKLEDLNIQIAESDLELTSSRCNVVTQALLALMQDNNTIKNVLQQVYEHLNKDNKVSAIHTLKNYEYTLAIKKDMNLWAIIFCNITFVDSKEPKQELTKIEIEEKMKLLESKGLTQGIVKEAVENFMQVYPIINATYTVLSR